MNWSREFFRRSVYSLVTSKSKVFYDRQFISPLSGGPHNISPEKRPPNVYVPVNWFGTLRRWDPSLPHLSLLLCIVPILVLETSIWKLKFRDESVNERHTRTRSINRELYKFSKWIFYLYCYEWGNQVTLLIYYGTYILYLQWIKIMMWDNFTKWMTWKVPTVFVYHSFFYNANKFSAWHY